MFDKVSGIAISAVRFEGFCGLCDLVLVIRTCIDLSVADFVGTILQTNILGKDFNFTGMITQHQVILPEYPRGFHLIDRHILQAVGTLPNAGLLHVFIQHTSAGICINENADPTVLQDFNSVFDRLVPEAQAYYTHNMEGDDDMPAHIKSVLTGHSVTIPIINGALALGTWQGIYLCEFRNRGGRRRLVVSIYQ